MLPLNVQMNGILLSSIWNIEHFQQLSANDFSIMGDIFYEKTKENPMRIPEIWVELEYQDLDNENYNMLYRIEFEFLYQVLCEGVAIKPKLYFENKKLIKKHDVKPRKSLSRISKKEMRLHDELVAWEINVFEALISLNVKKENADHISTDNAMKRLFYLTKKRNFVKLREVMIVFAFLCVEHNEKIEFNNRRNRRIIKDLLIKNNIINKDDMEIDDDLKKILKDRKRLIQSYFNLYKETHRTKIVKMCVYNSRNDDKPLIICIDDSLQTQLGFYRIGYSYERLDTREKIQTVAACLYANVESAFCDYEGMRYDKDLRWKCIYIR